MSSTTLTVRVSLEVKRRLGQLASRTRRTKSYLAAEAISDFVDRELAIIAGIRRGIDDMEADRVVPHKQAMRRLRATVTQASRNKR